MQNFNWTNPYPSVRIPLFARNVVSTSHPLAAQAGLRMLLKGGNAVDAAIAAPRRSRSSSPCRAAWAAMPSPSFGTARNCTA